MTLRYAIAVLGLASMLCACGGPASSPTPTPRPTATALADEAQKSSAEILSDAQRVISRQKSYHVEMSGADVQGALAASLDINSAGQITGTITQDRVTSNVVVVGTIMYVQQANTTAAIIGSNVRPGAPPGAWYEVRLAFIPILVTLQKASSIEQCVGDLAAQSVYASDVQKTSDGIQVIPLQLKPNDSDQAEVYVTVPDLQLKQLSFDRADSPPASCAGGLTLPPSSDGSPVGFVGDIVFSAYRGGVAGTDVTPPAQVFSPFLS